MRGGLAFDDVLDELLVSAIPEPQPRVARQVAGTATAYGFFFTASPASASLARHVESSIARAGLRSAEVTTATPECTPRRHRMTTPASVSTDPQFAEPKKHPLSAREREAFRHLAALGGDLGEAFTFDELRRAFRKLALRYHPDRHTGCGDHTRSQLAQTFAQARDAYQVLSAVFARVH